MTERERIEQDIRELIATETRATVLSNKLFAQDTGLFGRLAGTPEERRAVSGSELFRTAQARVRELQYKEAAALSKAAQVLRTELPNAEYAVRLDEVVPGPR